MKIIRDHFAGDDTQCDVRPGDQADDQAQLNAFVLRALALHDGVLERLRQVICQVQDDTQMRCYSPSAWERQWPWVLKNIFGGNAE